MQSANALVLEVFKEQETLKMSLFEQREFVSTLRHYSQCLVTFAEIDKLCQEVIDILNKAHREVPVDFDLLEELRRIGQLLWELLLTRSVKAKLKTPKVLDLVLSIDEELINIPWELLHDGSDFLCLKFNLGRLVRTKEESHHVQYRSFSSVPKMLILANPTNDLKSAYSEGVNIRNQFDRVRKRLHIDFKSTFVDRLYLKKRLRDYDIVHFAGHCEYDQSDCANSGWVLSDGKLTAQDILTLGSSITLPSLIFSNACHSAQARQDYIETDYQKKNFSIASAFLFSGVRHYIGAVSKIEDRLSLSFAKEFYAHLLLGKSVGEATRLGRLKLIRENGIRGFSWASYILYGDPNFSLFQPGVQGQVKIKRDARFYKKSIAWVSAGAAAIAISLYLYSWLPTLSPSTYFLFSKSRDYFHQGQNHEAIMLSHRIIDKDSNFLAAYPLLADAYSRIGEKEKALKYYFDYALLSEKKKDSKTLASAYIGIGWNYQLQGDYLAASEYYQKAIALSRKNKDKLNESVALRKFAVWNIDNENYDKALEFLTRSSEINRDRQWQYEHRRNLACDYFDIGLIFANKEDFRTAKEFYAKSLKLFQGLKLENELSDCYFNLGEAYAYEKQFQRALDYYMKGLALDQKQANRLSLASDYNMIGELYLAMDNLGEAENFFDRTIALCDELDAKQELADAYYNLGLVYKQRNRKSKVREYWRKAQEIYHTLDFSSYEKIKKELLKL